MAELLIASRPCDQCLTTRDRIVPGERAAEIINQCKRDGAHFICHKGSAAGLNLHCRGVHEAIGPCLAYRVAQAFNIAIREIDPEELSQ